MTKKRRKPEQFVRSGPLGTTMTKIDDLLRAKLQSQQQCATWRVRNPHGY
ncbi:MAG: hypothetical protein GY880_32295 [Planctomycetaceae bacterium]|nr:hypothetical protein [Planctomycetaceae bacterium]